MSKKEIVTLTRASELRVGSSRILREQAREHDAFLRRKVEAGNASMQACLVRSNEEIEAEFAVRRSKVGHSI